MKDVPHCLHADRDSVASIADHVDLSYHFVLKLVCKDYKTALPPRTRSVVADFTESISLVQWALAQGCPWDEGLCTGAAEGGHLEVLQWLRSRGCPWDESVTLAAAKGGHLEVVQWVLANGSLGCVDM